MITLSSTSIVSNATTNRFSAYKTVYSAARSVVTGTRTVRHQISLFSIFADNQADFFSLAMGSGYYNITVSDSGLLQEAYYSAGTLKNNIYFYTSNDKYLVASSNDCFPALDFSIDFYDNQWNDLGFIVETSATFTGNSISNVLSLVSLVITDTGKPASEYLDDINNTLDDVNDTMDEVNTTSKDILSTITNFFGGFFDNLIAAIVGLIVPSSEELSELFDDFRDFFDDHFGFLTYPFTFIVDFFDVFLGGNNDSTYLTLPAFSIMGHQVWSAQSFDLTSLDVVNNIFNYVRTGTGALLSIGFIGYLRKFFERKFGQ